MDDRTLSPFVLFDDKTDTAHELPIGRVGIGRLEWNEITIRDGSMARKHARLEVSRDAVEVIDHDSTNGTVIDGKRISRAALLPGDQFFLGHVGFTLSLTNWLTVEPPGELLVVPACGGRVDRAWANRAVGEECDDELWAALYLRWRRQLVERAKRTTGSAHRDHLDWPIDAIAWMCSPPVLQWIRRLLDRDDAVAWFLGASQLVVEALLRARHGIGPLLVHDVAANHPLESRREHADYVLRHAADGANSDVATMVFDRVPRDATSIAARIAPIFQRAQRDDSRWAVDRFLDYLSRPSFREAAETIIFSVVDTNDAVLETFRPFQGDLVTVDDTITLEPGQFVGVTRREHLTRRELSAWMEHLADFEVVQPFDQLRVSRWNVR